MPAFEDDDSLGLLANNDAVVLEAEFMDDTELRDMAVFTVVHAQPPDSKGDVVLKCARTFFESVVVMCVSATPPPQPLSHVNLSGP